METLTEITSAEVRRRQRAQQFESLQGSQVALRSRIKSLKAQAAHIDCAALEQMAELVGQVPPGIVTASRSSLGLSIPAGIRASAAIGQVVDACLADGRRREANRVADLKRAEEELANVENALKEFA